MSPVGFFPLTPSSILRMVNICEVVDLFILKPFWFFLRILSIWGTMRFYNITLFFFFCKTPIETKKLLLITKLQDLNLL